MAEFQYAFNKTMGLEGGYSCDPDDPGGETYRGISRRYHPSWPGWEIVDRYTGGVPGAVTASVVAALLADTILNEYVEIFYKTMFWDRMLGDELDAATVAQELFDTAVNLGVVRAVRFLQAGLNVLNRNGSLFNDLVEDGEMGPRTLDALNVLTHREGTHVLVKVMNILQGGHYLERMRESSTQEKYARGWLKRVEITRGAA